MPALTPPELDPRRVARSLYWQGWMLADIAKQLGEKEPTIRSWKKRDEWDKAKPIERVEATLEARLCQLVLKEQKTGGDFKEIDLLGRQVERLARVRRYGEPGGHEGDLSPRVGERNKKAAQVRPVRNAIHDEQAEALKAAFREGLFGYQRTWESQRRQRSRVILKSRQIGASWYFAREAFIDALETGRNKIFLSASKNQAHVFRGYIVAFAKEHGVELTGDPIVLPNGAELRFLGTNARTAQGYHGDFFFDEFFWTHRFRELEKVASGMATHKHWTKTYFSTPSSITHEAYGFWSGNEWNANRKDKTQRQTFDCSWRNLAGGLVLPDRKWRQIVTVEDAAASGCDLFDIDELRDEYSDDQFSNLFMCEFIDDTLSIFPLTLMQRCRVDSWDAWDDFQGVLVEFGGRPFGHRPVWVGYDPSHTGDAAALVVVAPPAVPGGKFRILEKQQFKGMDFAAQAAAIRKITQRYNVEHIAIDATGLGQGVFQLVKDFFPAAVAIHYSPEVKVGMVLKAQNVISRGRLEYDAGWNDVTQAFMAIRKTITGSGRSITYEAGRTEETGHADLAWATMHTLINEPLDPMGGASGGGFMEIY